MATQDLPDAQGAAVARRFIDPASGHWRSVFVLAACAVLVALPVVSIVASFGQAEASWATLQHLATTVMPRAALETLLLTLLVTLGVAVLGTTAAWLVVALDFPGRRIFEWAML